MAPPKRATAAIQAQLVVCPCSLRRERWQARLPRHLGVAQVGRHQPLGVAPARRHHQLDALDLHLQPADL
jgi:hypothetical protein